MTRRCSFAVLALCVTLFCVSSSFGQPGSAVSIPASAQIQPQDLVGVLQGKGEKPLVFQVGPRLLYDSNHIPGAEYMGAASTPAGIATLRARVKTLAKNKSIVLYCGCCPWGHCPNVYPAFHELKSLGFSNVKVLYLANNFHTDWIARGYPVEKGR